MLNTKPIKKKIPNEVENSDLKKTLFPEENANNKIMENMSSVSNKEILKLHNDNVHSQKENMKIMADIIKEREMKQFVEPDNREGSQNNNRDYTNNMENNPKITNVETNEQNNIIRGGSNPLIRDLASQIKNELNPYPHHYSQPQSQVIFLTQKTNCTNDRNQNDKFRAEWDEDKNSYIIYDGDTIEGFFTNSDIIKSIIQGSNINKYVKKYFFIISYDKETDTNEFIFIDSIFTDNLELIIRIQNSLFDLINNNEIFNSEEQDENLLIFNYQFIIFLFKKTNYMDNGDTNKIAKFYSTITYRFTSLVLKHILKIENKNITLTNDIEKLFEIKNDISSQLLNIESYLLNTDNLNDRQNSHGKKLPNTNNSSKYSDSNNSLNIINITSSENNTDTDTDTFDNSNKHTHSNNNSITSTNHSQTLTAKENSTQTGRETDSPIRNQLIKSNKNKQSILDEIISTLSNKSVQERNYDSEENGYKEINDNVSSYIDKQMSRTTDEDTISDQPTDKFSNGKNHYKIINKNVSTTDPSYNKNSAINNGKIYKIKL
jgi:hypothetical protein